MNELVDVEANLALEKENHSKTSQQLLTVQQQMALADESRKSKKIDTATMTSPVLGKMRYSLPLVLFLHLLSILYYYYVS
jgi:hypothetical protein